MCVRKSDATNQKTFNKFFNLLLGSLYPVRLENLFKAFLNGSGCMPTLPRQQPTQNGVFLYKKLLFNHPLDKTCIRTSEERL